MVLAVSDRLVFRGAGQTHIEIVGINVFIDPEYRLHADV